MTDEINKLMETIEGEIEDTEYYAFYAQTHAKDVQNHFAALKEMMEKEIPTEKTYKKDEIEKLKKEIIRKITYTAGVVDGGAELWKAHDAAKLLEKASSMVDEKFEEFLK